MIRYANLSGESGVVGYEPGEGRITVFFRDRSAYVYSDASAGRGAIATMMCLAREGRGLNAYISRTVRKGYERKFHW